MLGLSPPLEGELRARAAHLRLVFQRTEICVSQPGADRARTGGLLLAKQALSQLSYCPPGYWAQMDLNHRPRAYQARALTS